MFDSQLLEYFVSSLGPLLKAAVLWTIPLAVVSFMAGLVLAILLAMMRMSHIKVFIAFAKFYSWLLRGTPLVVWLFLIFYGLPSFGIVLEPFTTGVIGLAMAEAAYSSETIRAAMQAIPKGQWEAAKAVGMTKWQMYRLVIFPQAAAIAIPNLASAFISQMKDTSLTGVLTVPELFHRGQQITAVIYEPMLIYAEVAMIYLAINSFLSYLQGRLEIRFRNGNLAPIENKKKEKAAANE